VTADNCTPAFIEQEGTRYGTANQIQRELYRQSSGFFAPGDNFSQFGTEGFTEAQRANGGTSCYLYDDRVTGNNLLMDHWLREDIPFDGVEVEKLRLNMLYTGLGLKAVAMIALILTSNSQHELVQTFVAVAGKIAVLMGLTIQRLMWLVGVSLYLGTCGMLCTDRCLFAGAVGQSLGLRTGAPRERSTAASEDDGYSDDGDLMVPSPPQTPPPPPAPATEIQKKHEEAGTDAVDDKQDAPVV